MIRPLYKAVEPFMEVKRGYGYQGIVQYDDQEDKLQCHICGEWYTSLAMHVRRYHKIAVADYRDEYGLPVSGGLLALKSSARRSEVARRPENMKRIKYQLKKWGISHPRKRSCALRKSIRHNTIAHNRMSFKNGKGLCDLQIKARYDVVRNIVGHSPSLPEILKYDSSLGTKLHRIGFNKWKRKHGLKPLGVGNPFGDIKLISYLRSWASRNKKRAHVTMWHYDKTKPKTFPSGITFVRNYGSWQNAIIQAGLK